VTPDTISHVEERAQVERLLADPLFSQSKRYASFLRYVTERALEHNREPLTERSLGLEVFGRHANYDTDADPIVRVTASEVRKRLSQYYEDPAHANEIRILVHKGTYLVEFMPPGLQPAAPAEVVTLPPPEPLLEPATRRDKRTTRHYVAIAMAAVVLLVVAFEVLRPRPSIQERFWAPVVDGPLDISVSFPQFSDHVKFEGDENPKLSWTDPLTPTPDPMEVSWAVYSRRLVHGSDVAVTARIAEFLGSRGKHANIRGEHDLTMRDLREAPGVILGGLNNQWTSRLLPQARFTFAGEGTQRFIRDSQNPASKLWSFDAKVRSSDRTKDFIIISRVSDSVSGRVTVLAGGFSAWGTEAAVELLTDPNQMQKVLAVAPRKWDARNLQIVLECSVVSRESGIPRFLAAHFW
jgi:hypothetical protein